MRCFLKSYLYKRITNTGHNKRYYLISLPLVCGALYGIPVSEGGGPHTDYTEDGRCHTTAAGSRPAAPLPSSSTAQTWPSGNLTVNRDPFMKRTIHVFISGISRGKCRLMILEYSGSKITSRLVAFPQTVHLPRFYPI